MNDIFKTVFSNSAALAVFLAAASLLVLAVITIYVVAFVQGRSVSFWPPRVGPKPLAQNSNAQISPPHHRQNSSLTESAQLSIQSIKKGTVLVTSTGEQVLIESNSYTGVRATLMKAKVSAGRQVMVKLFWRGLGPDSTAWNAFSREYNAGESLSHRNVAQTFDQGLWNGYPFLVLEFFGGGTLYDLIHNRDRMSGAEVLSIAEQVASGLDYAHSQGRIHRDISPSNILLESDARGRVAISDFGIARILGAVDTRITAMGSAFEGTPAYVAPEIFSTPKQVTPAADIYSLGVVLFEMLAGRCPFPTVETMYELFRQKTQETVPRLSSFRKVPDDLDQRLFETLSPIPDDRPQTARSVLSGIEDSLLTI